MWGKIFMQCYCKGEEKVIDENKSSESGYDRVKQMYSQSDYGLISPQLYFLVQNATASTGVAFLGGALCTMVKSRQDYFRKNVASTFESEYLAKRHLSDTMFLKGFTGGLKVAAKYGSFSSLYLLCTMTVATYNNKVTIYEHIGSGALLGALFRFNFGLKGMAVAASLGGILGTLAGGVLATIMSYKNINYEDLLATQDEMYYEMRRRRPAHNY